MIDLTQIQDEEQLKALGYQLIPDEKGNLTITPIADSISPTLDTTTNNTITTKEPSTLDELSGYLKAFGAGGVQGATFSFGDEIAKSVGLDGDQLLKLEEEYPVTFTLGSIAGGMAVPLPGAGLRAASSAASKLGLASKIPKILQSGTSKKVAEGAATGIATGALEGLGRDFSQEGLESGAIAGGVVGTALPVGVELGKTFVNFAIPNRIRSAFGKIYNKAKDTALKSLPEERFGTPEYADRVTKSADTAVREVMIDVASSLSKTRDELYDQVKKLAEKQNLRIQIDDLSKMLMNDVDGLLSPERKTTLLKFAKKNLKTEPTDVVTVEDGLRFLEKAKETLDKDVQDFINLQKQNLIKESIQETQNALKTSSKPLDAYEKIIDNWEKRFSNEGGKLTTKRREVVDPITQKVDLVVDLIDPETKSIVSSKTLATNLTKDELMQPFKNPADKIPLIKQISNQLSSYKLNEYDEFLEVLPEINKVQIQASALAPKKLTAKTQAITPKGEIVDIEKPLDIEPTLTKTLSKPSVEFNDLLDFQTNLRRIKRDANLAPEDIAAFQALDEQINKAIQSQSPQEIQEALEKARDFRARYEGFTDKLTENQNVIKEDPFFSLFGTTPAQFISEGQPAPALEKAVSSMQARSARFGATDPGSLYQKDLERFKEFLTDMEQKGLKDAPQLIQKVDKMRNILEDKFLSDLVTYSGAELQPTVSLANPLNILQRLTARGMVALGTGVGKAQNIMDKLMLNPAQLEAQIQRLEAQGRPNAAKFLRQVQKNMQLNQPLSVKLPAQAATRFVVDQNPGARDFLEDALKDENR